MQQHCIIDSIAVIAEFNHNYLVSVVTFCCGCTPILIYWVDVFYLTQNLKFTPLNTFYQFRSTFVLILFTFLSVIL